MAFKLRFGPDHDRTVIPPEARTEPTSINAQLHALPVRRTWTYDVKGLVLYFPRTDMIMVPAKRLAPDGWGCIVAVGDETYPRDGYDLYVSDWEIQRAIEVPLVKPGPDGTWTHAGA